MNVIKIYECIEISKFIRCISLFSFFLNVSGCYLRHDVFLDVRYMEEKKGGQRNRKASMLVLYRSLLGC